MEQKITAQQITAFSLYLREAERSGGTIAQYMRDVRAFSLWLGEQDVTKEGVCAWKEWLCGQGKAASTVNSNLAALHSFLAFQGWNQCRVKYLKVQRRMFREESRELTRQEFFLLVDTARKQGKERLALVLETICATGIRVSEVKYITVEAIRQGRVDISLKGKIRTILLPGKLCRKLRQYAKKQKTASGEIFLTKSGNSLSRGQIWAQMKALCEAAGVAAGKVFPHNLRHLFARAFYKVSRDIAKLADVLGHSSIETTRIYLITTGTEHAKQLNQLGFVT